MKEESCLFCLEKDAPGTAQLSIVIPVSTCFQAVGSVEKVD